VLFTNSHSANEDLVTSNADNDDEMLLLALIVQLCVKYNTEQITPI